MSLLLFVALPVAAAVLAWLSERRGPDWPRRVALTAGALLLGHALYLWALTGTDRFIGQGDWFLELQADWFPRFGIGFHLAMDGLALLMVLLTALLGLMAVVSAWHVRERPGFFFFNLLLTLAGVFGVFLALDLFLFFFLWEAMLVPMYFLIAVWGYERRRYAALKFFLFTQASGLLMLVSIIALALVVQRETGVLTFDYFRLLEAAIGSRGTLFSAAGWIMLGFFVAFTVKLPIVPFHPWLPDAHTQAPTAASVLLAGILLKTGAYGLIRFVVPLFPAASMEFAPVAMSLGVVGILYGALLAIGQRDLKRLVAYTSVSHMGFVMLAIFAWTELALQGAVVQMIAHGLSTGALFMLVGALQERLHTRDLNAMGGLWSQVPRLAALGLFFAVASLGLPGLGNFVGEFLILLGSWPVSAGLTVTAALGLIAAAVYALLMVQRAFHGEPGSLPSPPDLGRREMTALSTLAISLIGVGLYPSPLFETAGPALTWLRDIVDLQMALARGGWP